MAYNVIHKSKDNDHHAVSGQRGVQLLATTEARGIRVLAGGVS